VLWEASRALATLVAAAMVAVAARAGSREAAAMVAKAKVAAAMEAG
jgi:hypothetical protein